MHRCEHRARESKARGGKKSSASSLISFALTFFSFSNLNLNNLNPPTSTAFTNGDIAEVSLDDYLSAGKYVVLAFYPKDFTYVCPTEIIAFSDRAKEFEEAGAQVLVASTDTEEVHGAWTRVARSAGGLGKIAIPMVADTKKTISAAYGCEW